MANIYWRKKIAYGRAMVDGKLHRKALGTSSSREAESLFRSWLAELETARKSRGRTRETTWREAVDTYMAHRLGDLKPLTRRRYVQSLLILTDHLGEKRVLNEITSKDLHDFVAWRRKGGCRKERISNSTIRRDLACLSAVFTCAIDRELIERNPVMAFLRTQRRGKSLTESDPRTRYLTHAEEELILTEALRQASDPTSIRRKEKSMIAAAIALYIDLGLRAQELLAAQHTWINLDRNELTVPASVAKSGKARVIPLNARARRIVEMLPKNDHTRLLLWRCDAGKRFSDLNKAFQRIAKDAGVEDVHIHDLRRTCGCRLLQDRGARMEEVSKWLGHASISMTERAYAFLSIGNLHALVGSVQDRSARDRLDALFAAPSLDAQVGIVAPTKLRRLPIRTAKLG